MEAMADGPVAAIRVCSEEAPRIARETAPPGMKMGRTSHRLRNPDNAPQEWMRPLLKIYRNDPSDTAPRTVALDSGRTGYVEPIYVNALCLRCHGRNIDDKIRTAIAERYPEDEAFGFGDGEFRGLFWVTLPAGETRD